MSTINLSNILSELRTPAEMTKTAAEACKKTPVRAPAMEKTAAHIAATPTATAATATPPTTATPTGGLNKLASDLAAVEHQTMVKEAQVFGSTMADAFATRLGDIQTVLDQSAPVANNGFNKTASMAKTAEDQYMEKVATDLYHNMDQNDANLINGMVKTAADRGQHLRPEEAFSVIADDAIAAGERVAMEKVAAAEVMDSLPNTDKALINEFTKVANANGANCNHIDAFQHMAKTAMERGEAACVIDTLPQSDRAAITGFTKTAQAQGHNIDQIDAFQHMAKTAMVQGMEAAKAEDNQMIKEAAERESEFAAMEKLASDMEARGDKEGVARLEKYAYDKGFEETLTKVAAHTSGIGYAQTDALLASLR